MRLVKSLVDHRVMQATMDPVDAEIGEENEEGELNDVVPRKRCFRRQIVQLGVTTYLSQHARCGEEGHERHGFVCLCDLHADLVLEVFWVLRRSLIKDEDIRESGAEEVKD